MNAPQDFPPRPAPRKPQGGWGQRPPEGPALDFQADAKALEDRPLPRAARATLYIIVALLAVAVAWAAWAELDRIVVAEGRIVTATPLIVVQPLETGTIRTIRVRPGDTVAKGDLLATLDPTFADAAQDDLDERLSQLGAEEARLVAELAGGAYRPAADDPHAALQAAIFETRAAERAARLAELGAEVARAELAIRANAADETALGAQLALSREVEAMRKELMQREAGSRMLYLQAQFERVGLEAERDRLVRARDELAERLEAAKAARRAFDTGWSRQANERLAALRQELASLRQQQRVALRRRSAVELRAPADAVVLDLARRSVGSVISAAEPLMTLVPKGVALEAEVEIGTGDIGRIAPGQEARVKFEALPFQRHGTAVGRLRVVAEDASETERGGVRGPPVFRARLDLDLAALRNLPEAFRLTPGLRVTAEIHVGRRTVLSYLFDPVLKIADESLREP